MKASRKFSVHPQMIFSLIQAQAGSLGKAVLENIMNAIDAKATKVTINVTRTKIKIVDDGHGFRSVQEIEDFFEVFGFPHTPGERTYGQFGIGRAQLWSFCSAIWRTNTFVMDVDIKNRGLDYHLKENQPPVQGLTIESKFYEPQSTQDIQAFKLELQELAYFAQIPVILNGEQLNVDPNTIKWNFDTDDAWIKLTDSQTLTVYNLGVMVCKLPSYKVGSGGLVVTKPGVKLSLNMARNDILVSVCEVWARLKPFIQKKSDEVVRKKTVRLNESELTNRARRFLSGALSYTAIAELKLVTDITGRSCTLQKFLEFNAAYGQPTRRVITTAEEGSTLGDRAHVTKSAFVLAPCVFSRFDTGSLQEFKKALFTALDAQPNSYYDRPHGYDAFKAQAVFEDSLSVAVPGLQDGFDVLADKEITKKERCVLRALSGIEHALRSVVSRLGGCAKDVKYRNFKVGVSDVAIAWTDAISHITFDRELLASADQGLPAFVRIVGVLVHEYLHDSSSQGSHIHDETFYKRFHDVTNSLRFGEIAFDAYRHYVSYLTAAGIKVSQKNLKALTLVESLESHEEPPVGTFIPETEQTLEEVVG